MPRFLDSAEDLTIWGDEFVRRHVPHLDVRLEVRSGDFVTVTLEVAKAEDVDSIVLVWRQDLSGDQGRVLRRLLVEARRPVLLVPRVNAVD